jgi:5-formyltetrahydrofolate cyclo-ligase
MTVFVETKRRTMEVSEQKKALRKRMFAERNAISSNQKSTYDRWINDSLIGLILERQFKVIHVYIPMLSEIDIRPMIQEMLSQKRVVVTPKTLPKRKLENRILHSLDQLETGIMGTQHPLQPDIYEGPIDLIVVPGMAFDNDNYRLGYGGGYYDNFIVTQPQALKVGIFYPVQKVDAVPKEPHDIQMDRILVKDFF